MIPQLRVCQSQDGRGKEHGFIVRMRNEQTYPFVLKSGKTGPSDAACVEPCDDQEERQACYRDPMHRFGLWQIFWKRRWNTASNVDLKGILRKSRRQKSIVQACSELRMNFGCASTEVDIQGFG